MIVTKTVRRKYALCNNFRAAGLSVRKPTLDEWAKYRVAAEGVRLYKTSAASIKDTMTFIEEKMQSVYCISEVTRKEQTRQMNEMVARYLEFDGDKLEEAKPRSFAYEGDTLFVTPNFYNKDEVRVKTEGGEVVTVPRVTVYSVTSSKPYYTGRGSGAKENNVFWNIETLGYIMYGKSILNGKEGIVRVIYDFLRTDKDKGGDYSTDPFTEKAAMKFVKASDNRMFLDTYFKADGTVRTSEWELDKANMGFGKAAEGFAERYKASYEAYKAGVCPDAMTKGGCEECPLFDRCKGYFQRPTPKEEEVVEKTMSIDDFNIEDEQYAVINAKNGIYAVDAGPGSGKSFSVAMRIANLIIDGTKPEKIMGLSFSNAAVEVLCDRTDYFVNEIYKLDYDVKGGMKIATFHSLCSEIISQFYREMGFTDEPRLYNEKRGMDTVIEAIDWEHPIDGFDYANPTMSLGSGGVVVALFDIFERIKTFNMSREDFDEAFGFATPIGDAVWNTFERYQSILAARNFIDYSDMENLVEAFIKSNQTDVSGMFDYEHIIVDEFQDSNDFQMLLLSTLINNKSWKSLMVIGDSDQAIYLFRNTSPENLIHFEEKMGLPGVVDLTLTKNRRSVPSIVRACNELLSINGPHKTCISVRADNGLIPQFKSFEKNSEELPFIAEQIAELIKSGVKPSDIAFISHTKAQLTKMQDELSKLGVLGLYDQPEDIFSDSKVKAAISLVNFLRDGEATKGVLDFLAEILGNEIIGQPTTPSLIEEESEWVLTYLAGASEEDKRDFLINLLYGLGPERDNLYKSFLEILEGEGEFTYEELVDYIYKLDKYRPKVTAERKEKYEAVSLVTAHSSKGKEWKNVFISVTDFDAHHFSREEMREKIRLCYVACSRAEDRLMVTSATYRKTKEGKVKPYNRFCGIFRYLASRKKVFEELS